VPIIPVKWIFGIKTDGWKKACLVVIGCRDPENYTAIDKASPTPSIDTTRWLFAHCSYSKMPLIQLDIVAAFIHAPLDHKKYITLPPGVPGNSKTHVAKLNRALYGLPTSPKCWYTHFDKFLSKNNFERSCREPCLYTCSVNNVEIILLCYVDEILITSRDRNLIDSTIKLISAEFDTKILGSPTRFLGIDITFDTNGNIALNQKLYLETMLQQYRMQDSNAKSTPIVTTEYTALNKTTPPNFQIQGC